MTDEDILVYPEEFKKGMREEKEHDATVGSNPEVIKKIVIDHLREDPKYYSKLSVKMKAEEEVQKDTRLPKKLTKGLSLGDKGIMRQSRKFEDKIGMTSPEKTMVRQKKNLPPMKAKEESYKEFTSRPEVKKEITKQKISERTRPTPYKITPPYKPKWQKLKDGTAAEKAEEESQLKWTPKPPKPAPVEKLKQSPKDEIESFLHLHQAEEETGLIDKIKGTIKGITSPKSPQKESLPPLTKSMVNKLQTRARRPSRAEEGEDRDNTEVNEPRREHDEPGSMGKAEVDNDSLNELYNFMMWLINNDYKPSKDKNFAKLIAQYDVEKFSDEQPPKDKLGEIQTPAKFKAEPKEI